MTKKNPTLYIFWILELYCFQLITHQQLSLFVRKFTRKINKCSFETIETSRAKKTCVPSASLTKLFGCCAYFYLLLAWCPVIPYNLFGKILQGRYYYCYTWFLGVFLVCADAVWIKIISSSIQVNYWGLLSSQQPQDVLHFYWSYLLISWRIYQRHSCSIF